MKRMIRYKGLPEIVRRERCGYCGGNKKAFCHDEEKSLYDHEYYPVTESLAEAAYRQGYEDGYRKAEDRAFWGPGWD